nr:integrase, catalytic region, zinc finger, CCHC-type, peptidase aspartic, catalytic [Tanacetum cinerariifolium]
MNALRSKSDKKPVDRKVWKTTGKVFKTVGYKWTPTGRTFTLIGNVCPLTRIATAPIVPRREPADNHDKCVVEYINSGNARRKSKSAKKPVNRKVWKTTGKVFKTVGYKWTPTGWTFTIVGNVCPLTRIATAPIVPPTEPIPIVQSTDKPVVTLVYTRKPRAKNVPNKMEPNKSWGSSSNVSTFITDYRLSKSSYGTVKFGNDHVAKIMGYGDYHIGNVTISRVYYVEGLGHNLFSVGQFCDSDLEVAFRQHTCFIRNLEGVDLLTGSRGNNLYTLSKLDEDPIGTPVDPTHYQGMANPTEKHLTAVKRVFQYLKGTINMGLWYPKDTGFDQSTFADVYHAVSYHFIKDQVENKVVELYFVKTAYQLADVFTKALRREHFEFLINHLGMQSITPKELKLLHKALNLLKKGLLVLGEAMEASKRKIETDYRLLMRRE